jgi:hypothetical protein
MEWGNKVKPRSKGKSTNSDGNKKVVAHTWQRKICGMGNLAIVIAIEASTSCRKYKQKNEMRWGNGKHKYGSLK